MSGNVIKSLRSLVKARERQGARLEEALAEQRRLLEQRQAEAADAQARRDDCVKNEHGAREERNVMMSRTFTPAALKALDFAIQDLAALVVQAEQGLVQAHAAVAQQEQAILGVQAEIRRNEQRIESFKERVEQLLRERDQAVEEQAEEEAEETAAARFAARQRKAREEAPHE